MPTAVARGTRTRQALHWDSASQHALAHTTPDAHTVACVGRSKGRLRAPAAMHRPHSRPSAAPLSRPSKLMRRCRRQKLLFESQAERSRPWFAQVPASVRDLAFSLQSYAAAGIRRAEVRLSMHCSQSAARRPACSAAHGGRGRGALVGAAPSRPAHVRSRLARPPATKPQRTARTYGGRLGVDHLRASAPPSPLSDGAHFGDFVSILRESAVCLRGAASRH